MNRLEQFNDGHVGAKSNSMDKLSQFVRQFDGKLTQELEQEHGLYGLGKVPKKIKPDATTTITCGFCSTGCGLNIHMKDNKAVNISPATDYPVNLGMACPKGWDALSPLKSPDRASKPYYRNSRGGLSTTSWNDAMTRFTTNFKQIQDKYGKDSVAFLSTGQMVTEELAFLGALSKFGMGVVDGDGNTRQCMATAVVAYKQSFGFDAPPYSYKDFEESDTIVLVGSNLCIAHPIMWERVKMNPHKPRIIVVDPRKTETAMCATDHYAIAPKSDLYLFYAIAHVLIKRNHIKREFIDRNTREFDAFVEHVKGYTPELASEKTGIALERIYELSNMIASGKRVSFWWTMGVNQYHEGVRLAQSMINLALMTGNIGRPGTGANSITGQCNAMGSRLYSNTTSLFSGYNFSNPEHRSKMAEMLNIDETLIPDRPSLAYDQILDAISMGKIKGLWVLATNSAHSWINQKSFYRIVKNLDYLVVQDMYHTTETAELADLILPAAAWGEKDGSFINSERRFGLVKRVSQAPGEALSDFNIFRLIAQYWGCAEMFKDWSSPEAVFQILKRTSKDQPCDITGIKDYQMLDDMGGLQWPYPSDDIPDSNERRLFEDGQFYHQDHKAVFLYEDARDPIEKPNSIYPFWLLTGRGTAAQWHTQTRTGKSAVLQKLYPKDIYVEINVRDARRLRLEANEWVYVESARAKIKARICMTYHVQEGQVFIPMHYKDTNKLTFPEYDKYSRQPSYKSCAVNIRRISHWEKK